MTTPSKSNYEQVIRKHSTKKKQINGAFAASKTEQACVLS